MNHEQNNAAHCYLLTINEKPCAWLSVLHVPHFKSKNLKKVHRLVVHPDFQGIGVGSRFLNEIALKYKSEGFRFTITTSTPSLIGSLKTNPKWKCLSFGRKSNFASSKSKTTSIKASLSGSSNSNNRLKASFEFVT